VILSDPGFRPVALQVFLPNSKNDTVYSFVNGKVNDPLVSLANFVKLATPIGWKLVVDPEGDPTAMRPPADAVVPTGATQRK
jgi:hypothetical protein